LTDEQWERIRSHFPEAAAPGVLHRCDEPRRRKLRLDLGRSMHWKDVAPPYGQPSARRLGNEMVPHLGRAERGRVEARELVLCSVAFAFWIDKSINRANATLNEIRKLPEWSARFHQEEIQKSSEWEHHLDQEIKKSKVMSAKGKIPVFAYLRTLSAANVESRKIATVASVLPSRLSRPPRWLPGRGPVLRRGPLFPPDYVREKIRAPV